MLHVFEMVLCNCPCETGSVICCLNGEVRYVQRGILQYHIVMQKDEKYKGSKTFIVKQSEQGLLST
jgi:hypothetical protein